MTPASQPARRRRRARTCPARLLVLVLCALAASGCRLDLVLVLDIERNGGGEVSIEVVADEELRHRARERGIDLLQQLREAVADAPGWRVSERTLPDGGHALSMSRRFRRPDELDALMADLAAGLAAPEGRLLEPFTLVMEQDTVRLRGRAGLRPASAVAEHGLEPAEVVRLLDEETAFTYTIRARMPGRVRETTGTREGERTVVWAIDPGDELDISVVADRPAGPLWAAVALGVALVAAGVVVALLARRRRRRTRPRGDLGPAGPRPA